jgi:hypothetical protein
VKPLLHSSLEDVETLYAAFGTALMIRRCTVRGQTPTTWWNFTAMTALSHVTTYLYYGEVFPSWQYVVAAITATLGGAAMACVVSMPTERVFAKQKIESQL